MAVFHFVCPVSLHEIYPVSFPDACFSSKLLFCAEFKSKEGMPSRGTPLRFASFRPLPLSPASPLPRELLSNGPLPLPLCGGAQAPWRASSLLLRLRYDSSDVFSLPFSLKSPVFALVSLLRCPFLLKSPIFALVRYFPLHRILQRSVIFRLGIFTVVLLKTNNLQSLQFRQNRS